MVPEQAQQLGFDTVPQKGLNRPHRLQPRGKALGGSSAIMRWLYPPATGSDYDHGHRSAMPVRCSDVLRSSSAPKTTPISTASITARAVRSRSTKLRSDNPDRQTFLQAAQEGQFRIAKISMPRITKASHLSVTAEERRSAGVRRPAYVHSAHGIGAQSARRKPRRAGDPDPVRGKARGRVESRQGKEQKQIRTRREAHRRLRRVPSAANC